MPWKSVHYTGTPRCGLTVPVRLGAAGPPHGLLSPNAPEFDPGYAAGSRAGVTASGDNPVPSRYLIRPVTPVPTGISNITGRLSKAFSVQAAEEGKRIGSEHG